MLNRKKIAEALNWIMAQCEYESVISYDRLWSIVEDNFDLINPHDDYKNALAVYAILANGKWDDKNKLFTWPGVELVYQELIFDRARRHHLKWVCDHRAEWV